jgi:hypothetical protein
MKVAELDKEMAKAKPDRQRVHALLRQMVEAMIVDYPRGQLVFQWKHGGENEGTLAWPTENPDGSPVEKYRGHTGARPPSVLEPNNRAFCVAALVSSFALRGEDETEDLLADVLSSRR